MGQRGKLMRPKLPHTGRPHARVYLVELIMAYTGRPHTRLYLTALNMSVSHGRVPIAPKFSPIQKRPLLRAFRLSKVYLNTLEED
ncbi:ALG-2 interacting X [Gossypium arboreum]|uniref:ALG-2 interacting X n=1 Tax=Gossypium arboreum TaxID=29729 RepID=A0A0B0P2D4_GOSAR|nr:ALG-2 interacting X [Gossypium arboreum]